MKICASEWAIVCGRPLLCINGFGKTEIESQLRNDLPTKTEVRTAAETVDSRDRVGIEDIMLVEVDAVGPVLSVEQLEP